MSWKLFFIIGLMITQSLTLVPVIGSEITPHVLPGGLGVLGRAADDQSTVRRLAEGHKRQISNVRYRKFLFPTCDGDVFTTALGLVSGYCGQVEQARARNCPLGTVVGFVRDSVTDEHTPGSLGRLPSSCVSSAGPVQITREMVTREFQELPLRGSGIEFQPQDGKPVINLPFVVQTQDAPQLLNTTILGIAVLIEATPTRFSWDYGDGSQPFVTTDPNKQYPDHSYEHTYTKRGPVTVTLTTTWQGRFQVAGGAWQAIPGTVTTNEASDSITVIELLPVNIN